MARRRLVADLLHRSRHSTTKPPLNQHDAQSNVLRAYPELRQEISRALQFAPELIRFVNPPSALTMTYGTELALHCQTFEILKGLPESELKMLLGKLLPIEDGMDEEFFKARKKLSDSELQLLGFEIYGKDGRHYAFRGILHNYGIEIRPDIVAPGPFKQAKPRAASGVAEG